MGGGGGALSPRILQRKKTFCVCVRARLCVCVCVAKYVDAGPWSALDSPLLINQCPTVTSLSRTDLIIARLIRRVTVS